VATDLARGTLRDAGAMVITATGPSPEIEVWLPARSHTVSKRPSGSLRRPSVVQGVRATTSTALCAGAATRRSGTAYAIRTLAATFGARLTLLSVLVPQWKDLGTGDVFDVTSDVRRGARGARAMDRYERG